MRLPHVTRDFKLSTSLLVVYCILYQFMYHGIVEGELKAVILKYGGVLENGSHGHLGCHC